jgi:hypothetical protein
LLVVRLPHEEIGRAAAAGDEIVLNESKVTWIALRRILPLQEVRRGEPKRYCSDACRARAWRLRTSRQER